MNKDERKMFPLFRFPVYSLRKRWERGGKRLTFAGFAMSYLLCWVSVVSFPAVMAMSTGCKMSAL